MVIVLIGLVAVGYGLYKMYTDQDKFDKYTIEHLASIQKTLDSFKNDNDD